MKRGEDWWIFGWVDGDKKRRDAISDPTQSDSIGAKLCGGDEGNVRAWRQQRPTESG